MNMPQFDITGQKVLLVGAGRGIGKGIALAFAEAGADVAVTGLTDVGASRVAGEIRALDRSALSLSGDATLAADMERIAQQVLTEFGRVDTLINCVGDAIRKPVAKLPGTSAEGMTEEEWHQVVNINLTEAFQGCRALGPHLLERGQGCVINISGTASFRGRALSTAYDAAKTGADALYREPGPRVGSFRGAGQLHRPGLLFRSGPNVGGSLPHPARGCSPGHPLGPGGRAEGAGVSSGIFSLPSRLLHNRPDLGRGWRRKHQAPVSNAAGI